jgi:hypothetical protein
MAKSKKERVVFTLYDDEPNPFSMSEEEYKQASEEYNKKINAENEKYEKWKKKEAEEDKK